MKTCPNCGSKMDPNVNFCTNCGSDMRNVPLDEQHTQPNAPQATQPQITQPQVQETVPTEPVQQTQAAQSTMPSRQEMKNNQETVASQGNPNAGQTMAAASKFDAHNMWQWFVESWTHPFQTRTNVSWYGWVTVLVENILLILGLYIAINKAVGDASGDYASEAQAIIANFSTSVLFELFLFIIIILAAMFTAVFFIRKFVYNINENFFDVVNRIVSCGNLSTIFYLLTFVCLLIGSNDMLKFAMYLISGAMLIIFLACYTMVVADPNPVNDKFYGLLILVVVEFIVIWILTKVFGQAVSSQIESVFHVNMSGMF